MVDIELEQTVFRIEHGLRGEGSWGQWGRGGAEERVEAWHEELNMAWRVGWRSWI